ncbi:hypothetical protein MMC07_007008 [Pseudocyphellaria aurata]|nr:hypothetical protein [Pseudocyphellaria aurata]
MDHEVEKLKKEYEEKLKRKSKDKDNNKDEERGKDDKKEKEEQLKTDHNEYTTGKEKNDKIAAFATQAVASNFDEIPRVYELHKVFYQKRLDRKRNAEMAKRDRERLNALKNPTLFPSVPRDNL